MFQYVSHVSMQQTESTRREQDEERAFEQLEDGNDLQPAVWFGVRGQEPWVVQILSQARRTAEAHLPVSVN